MTVLKTCSIALALLLTGCATQVQKPSEAPASIAAHQQHLTKISRIQAFSLNGRLGVVTQKQGFSGSIRWQHQGITENQEPDENQLQGDNQAQTDHIAVYSPLGGKVANISKNADGVMLTDHKGNSVKAKDIESLTEMTLGFKLPLTGLSDWALGRPTAGKINASSWDAQGRLSHLNQDGWDISYENYTQVNDTFLPIKLVLKSEQLNLKLLVEQWKLTE